MDGRCETCRFWVEGFCERVQITSHGETPYQTAAKVWPVDSAPDAGDDMRWFDIGASDWGLKTEPDFGCVQWEGDKS